MGPAEFAEHARALSLTEIDMRSNYVVTPF